MKFNKTFKPDVNKTMEYIKGYKIDDTRNEESIHANNLYDGISIIGNYSMVKLINESVSEKKEKIEENIAISYKLFEYASQMQNFLIENKNELEEIYKNSMIAMIENFSLDNPKNKDGKITIELFNHQDLGKVLYNGKGIESLENIKKGSWNIIGNCLKERRIIEILNKKLDDALSDSCYLKDEDDISMEIMESYKRIDYTRLENLSNPSIFENKEEILEEVMSCMYEYEHKITGYEKEYFTTNIINNFGFETYLHYMYIENIYTQAKDNELKEGEE